MKNTSSQGNGYRRSESYSGGSGNYGTGDFARVRQLINSNNLTEAEYELNRIGVKSAEWYYLRGVISLRKGWYSQAFQDLQMAVNMEPNNSEYRDTYNRALNNNNTYQSSAYRRRGSSDDMCDICTCLCCSDQCCECMGGDLISCC